ncbi:MAG: uracil phosphoribosyltransferase, partial [Acidimicrobiales bacterium]
TTPPSAFRQIVAELSVLIAYEALRDLNVGRVTIDTPVASGIDAIHVTENVLLVPVLRAGLGMIPAIQELLPHSDVAHIGLRRNEETLEPEVYMNRLPSDLTGRRVVICDPMLATGGSLSEACALVKEHHARQVMALCLIASRPGLERFQSQHPDVLVASAALDATLDHRGYILPGLGDAGDRLFGPPG